MQPTVLYILNAYNRGGAENGLVTLVDGGAFAGVRLKVVALAKGTGEPLDALRTRGVDATFMSAGEQLRVADWILAVPRLVAMFLREKPKVVILSLPQANIAGRLAAAVTRVPIVASFEHNTHLARRFYERLFRWTSPMVDWLIADCAVTAETVIARLYSKPPRRTVILPLIFFGAPAERSTHTDHAFSILSAGRLTPVKNQSAMLEAAAELQRRGRSFSWTIVGEGRDLEHLRRQIEQLGLEGAVVLPGYDPDWVRRRADVFVLASRHEGLCIVALEAMHAGMPVIAPRVGGLVDYGPEADAVLVDDPTGTSLADALARLMDSPDQRLRMTDAGRAMIQNRFGAAAIAGLYRQFAESLSDDQMRSDERQAAPVRRS